MAFTGTTTAEVNTGLDDIQRRLAQAKAALDSLKEEAIAVESKMTALGAEYNGIDGVANSLAAGQPTNVDRQAIAARVSEYLALYLTTKTRAQSLQAAVDGI